MSVAGFRGNSTASVLHTAIDRARDVKKANFSGVSNTQCTAQSSHRKQYELTLTLRAERRAAALRFARNKPASVLHTAIDRAPRRRKSDFPPIDGGRNRA